MKFTSVRTEQKYRYLLLVDLFNGLLLAGDDKCINKRMRWNIDSCFRLLRRFSPKLAVGAEDEWVVDFRFVKLLKCQLCLGLFVNALPATLGNRGVCGVTKFAKHQNTVKSSWKETDMAKC